MTESIKDTLYIDIDDEITAIVEKIQSSKSKIVALVLPKRANVFESLVNMKLLKRSADDAGKRLVLITSQSGVMALAGLSGVHIAKTLQSKPYLPAVHGDNAKQLNVNEDGQPLGLETKPDPTKSIGELSGDNDEAIELDDEPAPETSKKKSSRKLKIPNFEKFRTKLILGASVLVLLVSGIYYANVVAPKAEITIVADTQSIESNLELIANENVEEIDIEKMIIPAENKEIRKTDTETVPATGKKDIGDKATGKLSLISCIEDEYTLPAGSAFSSNNLSFIIDKTITLEPAIIQGNNCREDLYDAVSVNVTAAEPGDKYNLDAGEYASPVAGILAEGTKMTGGTSKIITVVSKEDIDGARQKLTDRNSAIVRQELLEAFENQIFIGLADTLKTSEPEIGTTPNVDTEAGEVTVTHTATYSMLGVSEDGIKKSLEKDVSDDIDTSKQGISDYGLDKAVIRLIEQTADGAKISIKTLVTAGPSIDEDALKLDIAGKKRGETQSVLNSYPGVRDVEINYSPFWVFSTPKNRSKIMLTVQQPDNNQSTSNETN